MIRRACQCLQEFCSSRNERKMWTNQITLKETEKPIHSSGIIVTKIIVVNK